MPTGITELELTDASTISIPTDAILILFLLIVFALIGYFFHKILDNQTNQFVEEIDDNPHLELVNEKLEDQLTLESAPVNHEKTEKRNIKKLNFIPTSKFWGIGSLAVVAIGGSSLLRIQSIQNSYKGINTSPINIKTENKSTKSLLSTNNSSKNNNFLQIQQRRTEDFFSF